MVWPELDYDSEQARPSGDDLETPVPVAVDNERLAFFRSMCAVRKAHPELRRGAYKVIYADQANRTFAFERRLNDAALVGVFNASGREVAMPALFRDCEVVHASDRSTTGHLQARGFVLLRPR